MAQLPCETPGTLSALGRSLSGFASALREHDEVTIVAIGSSSTKGDGANGDAACYPARLKATLSTRFPRERSMFSIFAPAASLWL
jgi:hypothetical protein